MRQTPMYSSRPVEWHVAVNDVPIGPIRRHELEKKISLGAVTRESLAWCEGLDDWRPAGDIPELSGLFASVPAPAPKPAPKGMPDAESLSDYPEEQTRVGQSIAAAIAIGQEAPSAASSSRSAAAAQVGFEARAETFTPPPELVESKSKKRLPLPILLCLLGAAFVGIAAAVYVADMIISDDGPELASQSDAERGPLEGDIEIPEAALTWESEDSVRPTGGPGGDAASEAGHRDRRRSMRPDRARSGERPRNVGATDEELANFTMGGGSPMGGPSFRDFEGTAGGPSGLGDRGMESSREIANESAVNRALSSKRSQLSRCASRVARPEGRTLRLDVSFQVRSGRASGVRIRQTNSPEVTSCVARVLNSANLSAAGSGRAKTTIILM